MATKNTLPKASVKTPQKASVKSATKASASVSTKRPAKASTKRPAKASASVSTMESAKSASRTSQKESAEAPAKAPPKTAPTSDIGRRRGKALDKGSASYREKRSEIAKAAALVFNKHGFNATSLSAVADELGMDRATLYYYISNKQELFDEVVREASELNIAAAEAARDSNGEPLDRLRVVITELMSSYAANYPLLYVYLRENLSAVDPDRTEWSRYMRGLSHRFEDAVIAIVQEGIDNGSIRPLASARVLAFGVLGMVGWTNRWFVPDRSPDSAETIGNAFAEMVVRGLAN